MKVLAEAVDRILEKVPMKVLAELGILALMKVWVVVRVALMKV